jgi:hypothetical protein
MEPGPAWRLRLSDQPCILAFAGGRNNILGSTSPSQVLRCLTVAALTTCQSAGVGVHWLGVGSRWPSRAGHRGDLHVAFSCGRIRPSVPLFTHGGRGAQVPPGRACYRFFSGPLAECRAERVKKAQARKALGRLTDDLGIHP